jgi:hypothetical protein
METCAGLRCKEVLFQTIAVTVYEFSPCIGRNMPPAANTNALIVDF